MADWYNWRSLASTDDLAIKRQVLEVGAPAITATLANFATVPGDQLWRILALGFTLTTNATVGTRDAAVRMTFNGTRPHYYPTTTSQAASLTYDYEYGPGLPANSNVEGGTNIIATGALPDVILLPGTTIFVRVFATAAGDAISAAEIVYEFMETKPGAIASPLTLGADLSELEHAIEQTRF